MAATMINPLGRINISTDVIAKIAGISATECYGIVGMAPMKASDGIVGILKMDNFDKGVKISISDDTLIINLYVIIEYGTTVPTVAENVIDTVKYRVESMTGLKVRSVNINVMGIRV